MGRVLLLSIAASAAASSAASAIADDESQAPRVHVPTGVRRVWLDVGTANGSEFEASMVHELSLIHI